MVALAKITSKVPEVSNGAVPCTMVNVRVLPERFAAVREAAVRAWTWGVRVAATRRAAMNAALRERKRKSGRQVVDMIICAGHGQSIMGGGDVEYAVLRKEGGERR